MKLTAKSNFTFHLLCDCWRLSFTLNTENIKSGKRGFFFCEIGPEYFELEISWNFNCCLLSCYFHQLVHLQYLGIFSYLSICYFNFKIISLNLSPVVSLSSLIHVHMSKTPFSFSRTHNLRPWWSAHVFHSRYYSHIEMFGMVFVVSCIGCGHIILLFVTCILFLSLPHYCAKFTQVCLPKSGRQVFIRESFPMYLRKIGRGGCLSSLCCGLRITSWRLIVQKC